MLFRSSAEITARGNGDLADLYAALAAGLGGAPAARRVDANATAAQKERLAKLSAADLKLDELAGERVASCIDKAPGNDAPFGGVKVATASGWFAARPSGTEDIYKIYAESFKGEQHLEVILAEAQTIVDRAIGVP